MTSHVRAIAWWVRIVLIVASFAASLPLAVMLADVPAIAEMAMVVPYMWLVVVSTSIERWRGGSHHSLGLPISLLAARFGWQGAMTAALAVTSIVLAAVAVGGTWTLDLSTMLHPGPAIAGLLVTAVLAAGEELLFRGVIFQALNERFGAAAAVLATSVPFGLAHVLNPEASLLSVVNTVLAGIALGAMVVAFRSLWYAIGFHVVWNIGIGAFVGPLSGWTNIPYRMATLDTTMLRDWRWFVDGNYGIEEGAVTTLALIVVAMAALRSNRYDAYVEAARMRMTLAQTNRPYTAANASTSVDPTVSP